MNNRVSGFGLVAVLIAGIACVGSDAIAGSPRAFPRVYEVNPGTVGNSIPLGGGSGGRYQIVFAADEIGQQWSDLGMPPGSRITGLQLRQSKAAANDWPSTQRTIGSYEVYLGAGAKPVNGLSNTFSENGTGIVRVRSGALTLAAGAYPGDGPLTTESQEWGPFIAFSEQYVYRGGDLVIEFRNSGASSTGFADAVEAQNRYAAIGAVSSPVATTGISTSAAVVRLTFVEPAAPFQTGVTRMMIPDELANTRGVASSAMLHELESTVQTIASESEVRRLGRGSELRGVFFRSADALWSEIDEFGFLFDMWVAGGANQPGAMSGAIAENIGAGEVLVRSSDYFQTPFIEGYGSGPRPAPLTFEIPFVPMDEHADPPRYTYLGGPLSTLTRHRRSLVHAPKFFDGLATTDPQVRSRVNARWANEVDAASTNAQTPFLVHLWSVDSGTIVPNENAMFRGANGSLAGIFAPLASTAQIILNASELTHIPIGSQITGLSLRGHDLASRPAVRSTFDDYKVFVSTAANRPGEASATFALNEGVDKVLVRSGPLHIPANGFAGHPTLNPFGPTIHFDRAFLYRGGDLCFTIRHSGGDWQGWGIDSTARTNLSRYVYSTTDDATEGLFSNSLGPIVRLAYNPSVVLPTAVANTPGNAGYAILFSSSGNVVQSVYAEEELRGLRIGSLITGMSLRRYSRSANVADWPEADTEVGQFNVTLSTSPVLPSEMSDFFANNIGADAIPVFTRSLRIPAKAFPHELSQVRPNENEWFIQFTEPFVYKGGPLSLTIRNINGSGASNPIFFADAVTGNPGAAGRWSHSMGINAAQHSQGVNKGALAVRFVFVPRSFCPADLNNDGVVEDADFVLFLSAYNVLECTDGEMARGCPADFNSDRVVDDADFTLFLGAYNLLVCP